VYNTGCPSIDLALEILKKPSLNFNPYKKYGGLGDRPDLSKGYVVVMQHPVTTEFNEARMHIEETLQAVKDLNVPALWFAPNADAGTDALSQSIRHYRDSYDMSHVHFFNNMMPEDFLRLVYNSKCLIGNSSMGIRECSFLGVPVVNIGTRQQGRERGTNVLDVATDKHEIMQGVIHWLGNPRPSQSFTYGTGDAGAKIADILSTVKLRNSKILKFQDEKPLPNTSKIRVKRSTRQKHKAA
jgi:UDP-hydrolysing UDP-N-acetyl-D-glucosamine 2-epimerase